MPIFRFWSNLQGTSRLFALNMSMIDSTGPSEEVTITNVFSIIKSLSFPGTLPIKLLS